jgi:zinc protease
VSPKRAVVIAERPGPGAPRPYAFPAFSRSRLDNGLDVIAVDLPGRPLIDASLIMPSGASDEPDALAGATILMARALTEGTERYSALDLVEAGERIGASLHAEAGWDATTVSVDVPSENLATALDLVAEVVARPTFPVDEVERLRAERLNDLLQARADPGRRAEEAFIGAIYAGSSPYRRSAAGTRETVERLDRAAVRRELDRRFDPGRMTLIVAGDLTGIDVSKLAETRFGGWQPGPGREAGTPADDTAASRERRVRVVHRPGSVQTEIRIGHPGIRRLTPDFHAVAVMSAILGGLFNSRLNRNLREDKGYTYGAHAGFDFRRSAGPFAARAAVATDVTVPAVRETLLELERLRAAAVRPDELDAARDYLIGVFPLRFETSSAVAGAIGGLVVQGLPDDELTRYRSAIAEVTGEAVLAAARDHVRPDEAAIVLVGDADAFLPALEAEGFGPITVDHDDANPSPGDAAA